MISKPSPYACISPYSIPLWTIFTKCPAPDGADVRVAVLRREALEDRLQPLHRLVVAADHQAEAVLDAPDTAGDAAIDEVQLRSAASAWRRWESRKFELPPSTIVSPGSRIPSSSWNASSVIFPAGIISHAALGFSSCDASSSSERRRGLDLRVVRLDVVTVLLQPPGHSRAHPSESDHSELH